MKKIILASSSPRRKELLSTIINNFEVISPKYDESKYNLEPISSSIKKLSLLKAQSISVNLTVSALVISADTVVIADNKIMGKPKDKNDAFRMIKTLSGRVHKVITAIAIIDTDNNKEYTDSATTYVTFNELSDDDIWDYIDSKKPFDKAGAYGIQELPEFFVKNIEGYFDNVVACSFFLSIFRIVSTVCFAIKYSFISFFT